jgi:hypothetical protein
MTSFYVFMFAMALLIPVVMIIIGVVFIKRPPKKINGIYGYRTKMSRKSQETWDFAHHYFARIFLWTGIFMMIPSAVVLFLIYGQDADTVGRTGGILEFIQCVFLFLPILFTERALRKNFDENGRRR